MAFDEFYFIEGQPVRGHIKTVVDPFHIPLNKEKLDASVKEEKKKRRRKKLLKLMILSQMMNSQK